MDGIQAIAKFRRDEGLDADGGDGKHVDWGRMFGMPVPIPNTSARRPLVPYHDLHHWVAGYRTDEIGEGEVSAWTIATGGPQPFFGHMYDLGALLPGLIRAPGRCWTAFLRGRRCRNLYGAPVEHWLAMDTEALRAFVGVEGAAPVATWRDGLALLRVVGEVFVFWVVPIGPLALLGTVFVDLWAWATRPMTPSRTPSVCTTGRLPPPTGQRTAVGQSPTRARPPGGPARPARTRHRRAHCPPR